jgi:potassium inwardly-rectifying channel subfamily J
LYFLSAATGIILYMCTYVCVCVCVCVKQVGLVFLKMVRPKQRTRTLEFSDNAVVCRRNGKLCLMFRVGDVRRSHIIEAKMRVLLVQTWTTPEGEVVSPFRTELKVCTAFSVQIAFSCMIIVNKACHWTKF